MRSQQRSVVIALLLLLATAPLTSNADVGASKPDSCPVIRIDCSSDKRCCGPGYTFTVNVTGGRVDRNPTYNWSVSCGKITKGQGTSSIGVEAECENGKPITATVEVGNVIPEGCRTYSSLTAECENQ